MLLTIASHNVRGFNPIYGRSKIYDLLELWNSMKTSIVCIQETHLTIDRDIILDGILTKEGWMAYKCCYLSASKGTMILIRRHLLDSRVVEVSQTFATPENGRIMAIHCTWGGHQLVIANLYLPNKAGEQIEFMKEYIPKLRSFAGSVPIIYAADWNFVIDPPLDRFHRRVVDGIRKLVPASERSTRAGSFWLRAGKGTSDIWRYHRGVKRHMTRFDNWGGARLDRFHVDNKLLPYSLAPKVKYGPGCLLSDHSPVVLALQARTEIQAPPRSTARLRMKFIEDQGCKEDFGAWLEREERNMPAKTSDIIPWWQRFTKQMRAKVHYLNRQAGQQDTLKTLEQRASDLHEEIHRCEDVTQGAVLLQELLEHRQEIASTRASLRRDRHRQVTWLHHQERPNRAISYVVKPPTKERIDWLIAEDGQNVTTPTACAEALIRHWQKVSTAQEMDPTAQEEVLMALSEGTDVSEVSDEDWASLNNTTITPEEVMAALKHTRPGTAPGSDGIPGDLYRIFRTGFAGIISNMLSAIWETGMTPRGFLDSTITVIHKGGARTSPSSYRPISLTPSIYRVLTKVLMFRLRRVLSKVIDPCQTAFLPGRSIGHNTVLLQLIPEILYQQKEAAYIAFCDIRKAYDTVDRDFLIKAVEALGFGDSFSKWVQLLHSDTYAQAKVNGFLSSRRRFTAGVRQGCPLAPQLYLLISQALLCYQWKHLEGIQVTQEVRLHASLYADDNCSMLRDAAAVDRFVHLMGDFSKATGQQLQAKKSQLLPIGRWDETELPEEISGIPVVRQSRALGFEFLAFRGKIQVDWEAKFQKLGRQMRSLQKCPLSMFGRAFSVNGYILSKLFYFMEFAGLPSETMLHELDKAVNGFVQANIPPWVNWPDMRYKGPQRRGFRGPKAEELVGHPIVGGVGLLDYRKHIVARQAKWFFEILRGDPNQPWIRLAKHLFVETFRRDWISSCFSDMSIEQLLMTPEDLFLWWPILGLEEVPLFFRPMISALRQLPRPQLDKGWMLLKSADWWAAMPVMTNPYIIMPAGRREAIAEDIAPRMIPWGPKTVGELVAFTEFICDDDEWCYRDEEEAKYWFGEGASEYYIPPPKPAVRQATYTLLGRMDPAVLDRVTVTTARASLSLSMEDKKAAKREVWSQLVNAARWPLDSKHLTVTNASVKTLYKLQWQDTVLPQQAKFEKFARSFGDPELTIETVQHTLRRLWHLKWPNADKEVYWRVVLDAIPTPKRLRLPQETCVCMTTDLYAPLQGLPIDTVHVYFDCMNSTLLLLTIQNELERVFVGRRIPPSPLLLYLHTLS